MYRSHPEVYSFILILIIPLHNHRRADDEPAHSIVTPPSPFFIILCQTGRLSTCDIFCFCTHLCLYLNILITFYFVIRTLQPEAEPDSNCYKHHKKAAIKVAAITSGLKTIFIEKSALPQYFLPNKVTRGSTSLQLLNISL